MEFDPVEAVPVMAGEGQPEGNGGDSMFTGMQQDFQQGLDLQQQQQQQQQQGFMQEQQPSMFGAHVAGAVDMEA